MSDTRETALAVLEGAPAIFRLLLERLPEDIVTAELDRGWSPKRILAHMVDVEEAGFADRMRMIVAEHNPAIAAIDPMATLEAGGLMAEPVGELLERLETSRRETCAWLRGLAPEQFGRKASHRDANEFTLDNLLHYWPVHDMAHVRGIVRMLQSVLHHETAGLDELFDV